MTMDQPPRRLSAADPTQAECLGLIQRSFSAMDGRIDPPSSMHQLTLQNIRSFCQRGEVWAQGTPVMACVFLTRKVDHLYLGKLAVAEAFRGKGLAGGLVQLATHRAQLQGLRGLEVEVRIELTENHAMFHQLGFRIVGYGKHEGFDKPTFLTMRKPLD